MATGKIKTGRKVIEATASSVTVPSSTGTTIASIVIPESGVWMIVAAASFPANATGNRQLGISFNQTANWGSRFARTIAYGNGTYQCRMLTTTFDAVDANTVLYARAFQDSGTSMSVTECGIKCVKISD